MTKTAGFSLIELMIVIAIMATLAAMAVPTFISYRDKSRVAQVVGSSEVIRSALASYAADSSGNAYPLTGAITDFSSLRLVVNKNGGMLPSAAIFTLGNYAYYDSDGDGIADTYSMRLIVNGVSPSLLGSQILLTPEGILKCTPSGHPC
jgi:prepilin-type N-terminal cleavage/methylation domain-containing protein